jgi:cobalt-zinc-cadmium efflux system membrane fusion protein
VNGSRAPLIAGAAACLVGGLAIGYALWGTGDDIEGGGQMPADSGALFPGGGHQHGAAGGSPPAASDENGDVTVTLTPEMAARAGINTVRATASTAATALRLPGVVQPNAYREVAVTSLVSGRVTQVSAELGARVTAQQPLATIYSPELAEAQTGFIAARAEQLTHQQRQTRTQRLTAIGAATREELEMHEAERARVDAEVEIARARLSLLGIPEEQTQRLTGPQDVITTHPVRSPLAGVVTKRSANVGLNIDLSTPLFTVTDLSTVWVIADLYERDFARVRIGSPANITSVAYPGVVLRGRVSYIDPQVQPETRTAKLRIEVPNAGERLRLGMFVDAQVGETESRSGVLVPKSALQPLGSDTVVFVADENQDGLFHERKVEVAHSTDGQALVVSGLSDGDRVVTDGAFFLRAERERRQSR